MPRKTHKKMRGGKLLGQGTYGCTFKPSLICTGEAAPREGIVSKMLSSVEAKNDEIRINQAILRIDPERKYFITALGSCLHDRVSRNNSINSRGTRCRISFTGQQNYLIFYPMGGEASDSIRIRPDKYASAIKSFRNLLEGILTLHAANMVHLDIKPDNILSLFSDGEYKTRFIDFGLSDINTTLLRPNSDVLFQLSSHLYNNRHYYYPIDLILMNNNATFFRKVANNDEYNTDRKSFIAKWYGRINNLPFYPESSYFYYKNGYPDLKVTYENFIQQLLDNRGFYNDTNRAIKTVDIASLGVSLAQIYSQLTGHYSRIEPDTNKDSIGIITRIGNEPSLISLLNVGNFGEQQDVFEWHMNLANNLSIKMYDLINKMMTYDGPRRLTATEALALFDTFVGEIDRCFENVELTKKALTTIGIEIDNTPVPVAFPIGRGPRGVDPHIAAERARADAAAAERARADAAAAERARADAVAAERARADAAAAERARAYAERAAAAERARADAERAAAERARADVAAAERARADAAVYANAVQKTAAAKKAAAAKEREEAAMVNAAVARARAAVAANMRSKGAPLGALPPSNAKAAAADYLAATGAAEAAAARERARAAPGIYWPPPKPDMPVPLPAWPSEPVNNPMNTRAANMAAATRAANTQRKLRLIAEERDKEARARIEGYGEPLGMPAVPISKAHTGYAGAHAAGLNPYRAPLSTLAQNPYSNLLLKAIATKQRNNAATRAAKAANRANASGESGGSWNRWGGRRTRKQKKGRRL